MQFYTQKVNNDFKIEELEQMSFLHIGFPGNIKKVVYLNTGVLKWGLAGQIHPAPCQALINEKKKCKKSEKKKKKKKIGQKKNIHTISTTNPAWD